MGIGKDFIALGEYLDSHPGVEEQMREELIQVYVSDLKSFARHVGACEKVVSDDYFELVKRFGSVTVSFFNSRRTVCERVKVGEKEIPEQIIPAREEEIVPAHTEPIYEWKCPESLLAGAADGD